eukprot:gene12785-15001_t
MKVLLFVFVLLFIIGGALVDAQLTAAGFPVRVFDVTSPWNTVIPATATVDPASLSMITSLKSALTTSGYAHQVGYHYFQYTSPLHRVNSSTFAGRITILQTLGEGFHNSVDPLGTKRISNLPVPTSVMPDPGLDGHMIVYDRATTIFHEFSRFAWINSTHANATRYDTFLPSVSGYGPAFTLGGSRWWMKGVRGSGAPFIAGLIRMDEIQRGELQHALAISGPTNRKKRSNTVSWDYELCSPVAMRTDGWVVGTNTIMEGQRIRLKSSFNTASLSPVAKLIAQALKTYGGYMVDNSPDFGIFFENLGPAATSGWNTYAADISSLVMSVDNIEILSCATIGTK